LRIPNQDKRKELADAEVDGANFKVDDRSVNTDQLKARIAAGTYNVTSDDVAGKLISNMLGDY
jgi:anti-sigma28 factor (negative regulator of flagellin synthesis)